MKNNKMFPPLAFLIIASILAFALILQPQPQPPADGWLSEDSEVFYILDGVALSGWQHIDGNRYYFDDNGLLQTGWQTIDGDTYFFRPDGIICTGWLEVDNERFYLSESGIPVTGWQTLDGAQYYFTSNGAAVYGAVNIDENTYLFGSNGLVRNDWIQVGADLYYADEQGYPVSGWTEIDGSTHYFHADGIAANGWVELDNFMYYFYTDGAPAQGQLRIDGDLFHFASNGQQVILVNPWNYLPENYAVTLIPITNTHMIAAIAYEDYIDMMADCAAAGLDPAVCSAYRTYEYQENLYQNRIDRYIRAGYNEEEATELAGQSVAIPGTSEHQLGFALDIVDENYGRLDEKQAKMPTQKWLMENSWRYGWILRYPDGKSEITGIVFEPWHYRYVGKTIAKEIYESGLCLEEYLQLLTTSVG